MDVYVYTYIFRQDKHGVRRNLQASMHTLQRRNADVHATAEPILIYICISVHENLC